jgi:STE24 endopeptidase
MAINPETETARYIDSLGPDALAKAADYTHGDHWLLLWGIVVTAIVTWIIVRLGVLERVSAKLEKRGWALRTWLVCVTYFVISTLIALPWTLYEEYFREKSYGRTSQSFADYLGQSAISMSLSAVISGLFFLGIYALIRKTGKRWWLWSGGLTTFAAAATILLSPLLIEPIFNDYKPVPEGPVRAALITMADSAQIPQDRILMFDGSRQSNNFTANVSGAFGSARIAISDVALKQASLDEVKAVTGHEVGHYVLGHIWPQIILLAVLAIVGFYLANSIFQRFASAFGSDAAIGDPQGLPVLILMISLFMLFAQPVINAVIRHNESAADLYSLRTVNLPDALAGALVKTAEYRNPRPTVLEEAVFYDHPSVERRVRIAMEWKATHPVKD